MIIERRNLNAVLEVYEKNTKELKKISKIEEAILNDFNKFDLDNVIGHVIKFESNGYDNDLKVFLSLDKNEESGVVSEHYLRKGAGFVDSVKHSKIESSLYHDETLPIFRTLVFSKLSRDFLSRLNLIEKNSVDLIVFPHLYKSVKAIIIMYIDIERERLDKKLKEDIKEAKKPIQYKVSTTKKEIK